MKKRGLVLSFIFIILFIVNTASVFILGKTYTYTVLNSNNFDTEIISVVTDKEGIIKTDKINDESVSFSSISNGTATVLIEYKEKGNEYATYRESIQLYSTRYNTLVCLAPHFDISGNVILAISMALFIIAVIIVLIISVKQSYKNTFYSYKNILYAGLILFFTLLLGILIFILTLTVFDSSYLYLSVAVQGIVDSGPVIAVCLLPIVIFVFLSISASNLSLILHEGRSIKNLLGIIIGIAFVICPLLLIPIWQVYYSLNNFSREAYLIRYFAEVFVSYISVYFDCMFFSAIFCSLAAVKRQPAYDKDFIIILGCGIKKDGTLQPLLKGRVDRAISFVKKQAEITGKKCIFIPSGGQGEDEVISEAEAMKNYLISQGIDEHDIVTENKSMNTYENMKFSKALIDNINPNARVAFSTTNYHLFRSGMYSQKVKLDAEGIGSKTKYYFWPNAFLREFVGIICSKIKYHIFAAIIIFSISLLFVLIKALMF